MSSIYKAAIVTCIIELVLTATWYVPISTLIVPALTISFLERLGIENIETAAMVLHVMLYIFLFFGMYSYVKARVFGFVVFSIAHYYIWGPLMLMWFGNSDGQAFMLIIPYSYVSAVLVLPIAWLWNMKRKPQPTIN